MSIVSYAQNFEDVMLWRALGHVENGFYIDIGAQHPLIDSVSKAFYEKGWRGIHVEATPAYATLLRQDRPDEIVVQAAVNDAHGTMVFYEIPETGISTGDAEIAQSHKARGFVVHEITVPCVTLQDIFRHAQSRDIHWLKIDVEGMERQVLDGWGECQARPWIVVVESTLPLTQTENHQQWEACLLNRDYTHMYFDGLNRYYLSPEHPQLATAFSSGPNVFDGFTLDGSSSASFCLRVNEKHRQAAQAFQEQIAQLRQEQIDAAQEFDAVREKISNQLWGAQEDALKTKSNLAEESTKHVAHERALLAEIQTIQTQWRQAEQAATQREQALQELASETYRQTQTQAQAHLHTLAQREQAFGQQLQELQTQMRDALAEANQHERALQADFAEALRQAQTQAQAHLHTLAQREQTFGQQLQELQTQMRQADKEATQREAALGKEISALQHEAQGLNHAQRLQAQQHDAELNTRLDENKRLIEACAVLEAQLKAEILSGQQANLGLRQSLSQVQQSLATTHASLAWRMTAPLRALASFIAPPKKLNAASLTAEKETDAILTGASAPQSIAIDQHPAIEHTIPSSEQAIKQPVPTLAATLDELLACHDQYFVQCAYQTLLGRAPDPEGLRYYLDRLRTGFSKIQILSQLRLSKEGRSHAAKLPGLDMAIRRYQKEQYPVIGWLFRQRNGGEGKHPTGRKLRAIENQLGLFNDETNRRFNQIEAALADSHHLLVQQTQSVTAAPGTAPLATSTLRPEPDGFKQLSPRAREIYFQLETAVATHARRAA